MATSTVGSGQTYADLNAWEAALPADISATGDEIAECYPGANLVAATNLDFAGVTQGSNLLIVRNAAGEHWAEDKTSGNRTWDTALPYASRADFQGWLNIDGVNMRWEGIQLESVYGGSSAHICNVTGAAEVVFTGCRLRGPNGAAGDFTDSWAITFDGASGQRGTIVNCLFEGWYFASNSGDEQSGGVLGLSLTDDKSVRVYNCTFVDCVTPVGSNGGIVVINCIAENPIGGWEAGFYFTDGAGGYNSSTDATQCRSTAPETNQTFAFEGSGDYTLTESRAGLDVDPDPTPELSAFVGSEVATDAAGVTRTEWTRGAFEYVAGGDPVEYGTYRIRFVGP